MRWPHWIQQTPNFIERFSLKFQKIVQDEQQANFITRLHHGKLAIIPWPTIGSKDFYKLFPALWKHLDHLEVTHKTAGGFLLTLKTLMAKLKVRFCFLWLSDQYIMSYRQMIGGHCHVGYLETEVPKVTD